MSGEEQTGAPLGLGDAYAVRTPADNLALYRGWAATYEQDFIAPRGYVYHENVAALFAAHHPGPDGLVLDVGCGTGIVGEALQALGQVRIDGLDLSPEMLAKAADKNVYERLIEADLTQVLPLNDANYDGVVSAGTFTHGHVGPEALTELLRVAAAGARFALGVNAEHYHGRGFAARFDQLAEARMIDDLTIEQVRIYNEGDAEHADDLALVVLFAKR